jgi:hypothetical protein
MPYLARLAEPDPRRASSTRCSLTPTGLARLAARPGTLTIYTELPPAEQPPDVPPPAKG